MVSFTEEQVEYLRSLPAVSRVSSSRISYARWFRDECLARYAAGEHPVDLFRRAGMGPELIGYKRIERAFARWRRADHVQSLPAGRPSGSRNGVTGSVSAESATVRPDMRNTDVRDLLIGQQTRYIRYLEGEIARLRASVGTPHAVQHTCN